MNIKKYKKQNIFLVLIISFIMIFAGVFSAEAQGDTDIRLIVDGNDITNLSKPIILKDRLLVPLRFVFEEIGGDVQWNSEERSVTAVRGDKNVYLRIDSRIIKYGDDSKYNLSDVTPIIRNTGNGDRTYVPIRLVSNGLGIGINWDEEERAVYVNSKENSQVEEFFDVNISSHQNNSIIKGKEEIKIDIPNDLKKETNKIKLILIEKDTRKGFIVGSTTATEESITYLPKISDNGDKLMMAGIYNQNNEFLAGDILDIRIAIEPKINLLGVVEGQTYSGSVILENSSNFFPYYIKYQFKNLNTGNSFVSEKQDSFGEYQWKPTYENNGTYEVKAIAFDKNDTPFESNAININIAIDRFLNLAGVSQDKEIENPVNLIADRNFHVNETQFIIRDYNTKEEKILETIPYGAYTWFPGPEESGVKELMVRVEDTKGQIHDSSWIKVNVIGNPKIILKAIGPNEIVTGDKKLSYLSNVKLDSLKYILTDKETGTRRIIYGDINANETTFKPVGLDEGKMTIKAEATYNGKNLSSEVIDFNVYLGETYSSKPIVPKEEFLDFASKLSIKSKNETGMSAALQTAQAILETGWGQYIPVDKYNGKFSYNLFGIKGEGSNGSIISNTWEVYNGISFRVDDYFRAYHNVEEAWQDHKNILLNLERYKNFRKVMYDSEMGAWAVKRAGYATDPQYPVKLINIIETYDLNKLDEVEI